jgi:hypothetical protein
MPAECSPCENGNGACATYDCLGALCQLTCQASGLACKYSSDCPAGNCGKCLDGSCAIPACIEDTCQLVCLAQ